MFIDCHTHAFADKIAERAVEQLITHYHIDTPFGGRFPDLLDVAAKARLNALILLVAATKPEQLKPANDWVLSIKAVSDRPTSPIPRVIPFGAFHPDAPDWPQEITRLRAAGIKGIKLHPEFQQFDLADPKLFPFWETVKNDFILMIHVGDTHKSPANLSTPRKIADLLENFPGIKIIAAHLGGYGFWEEALEHLAGKDVYLDTSSSLSYIEPSLFYQFLSAHGADKILFGSDYPLKSPAQEREYLEGLPGVTAADRRKILGENCAELLGI